MVQIAVIGMQSCLDLHPRWRKYFRRFNIWVRTTITQTSFFNNGMLVLASKQKNLREYKAPMESIRVRSGNLQRQSPLMSSSSSSRFNHLRFLSARTRYKMSPMACLIRPTELCHLCLKEFLGVFSVPRSLIRLCKSVIVFFVGF